MTGKQKVFLRKIAHDYKPVFQIGKEGVQEKQLEDILNYLNKHELMKVSILETCPNDDEELKEAFELKKIEVVQKIGRIFVLYKENKKLKNRIILPKAPIVQR